MEKKKSFIINSIYLAVWILIIYFLITFASAYLLPFLIGIIIAHLVQKPAVFMNKKIGIKKNKCAAILSVIIYLFVSIIIFLFFWFIFSQFNRFVKFLSNNSEQLKIYFDNIFLKIESLLNKFNVDNVKTLYNDAINSLIVNVTSYFSNAITSLVKIPAKPSAVPRHRFPPAHCTLKNIYGKNRQIPSSLWSRNLSPDEGPSLNHYR